MRLHPSSCVRRLSASRARAAWSLKRRVQRALTRRREPSSSSVLPEVAREARALGRIITMHLLTQESALRRVTSESRADQCRDGLVSNCRLEQLLPRFRSGEDTRRKRPSAIRCCSGTPLQQPVGPEQKLLACLAPKKEETTEAKREEGSLNNPCSSCDERKRVWRHLM